MNSSFQAYVYNFDTGLKTPSNFIKKVSEIAIFYHFLLKRKDASFLFTFYPIHIVNNEYKYGQFVTEKKQLFDNVFNNNKKRLKTISFRWERASVLG